MHVELHITPRNYQQIMSVKQWVFVMYVRCAPPVCSSPFLRLRSGRSYCATPCAPADWTSDSTRAAASSPPADCSSERKTAARRRGLPPDRPDHRLLSRRPPPGLRTAEMIWRDCPGLRAQEKVSGQPWRTCWTWTGCWQSPEVPRKWKLPTRKKSTGA